MDFLILGPIEVRVGPGVVALGGIKPRAVLAILLLHANEPVSAERLALALWGEDAPGGAVKTVQVHVSRLRKALGDADVLSTTPAGYRLRVDPGELDAERFETLVDDARRALADSRFEDASATLREALALWRGPALAELALEPFAGTEIARLEEQRLAALELRVHADLAAGRHAEVVGELQRLVVEHPTREQLAGQLMLALYRCGRQTEALEAYASARRVLVDEIGVEPGPQLRELQQAILRHDAALVARADDPGLPPALDAAGAPPLVGRDAELAWLTRRWARARAGRGAFVVLTGERGAGKSRLAAELARAVHEPGIAVLHANGDGPADTVRIVLNQACAATRPTLLVIDDADRLEADVLAHLARLAPALRAGPVLVVACAQDTIAVGPRGAAEELRLGSLGVDAVGEIAAAYVPARPGADPRPLAPADWLLEASGGLPRRVHEHASQWAHREAARHVGAVAGMAAAGRSQLRSLQDELTGGLEELQAAGERRTRAADDDARIVCPYKGLATFEVADAPYFFGRERLVAELVAGLVGAPLLGIVGRSGSGKSSVLRAGLLPALESGVLPGSEGWAHVLIRPGTRPVRELARGLAAAGDGVRTVIAVDQFEEVFTTCDSEDERAEFIGELVAAATDRQARYLVVVALRADFYGRCGTYPELARLLAANHALVGAMQRDELRRAVEQPAARAGLRVDPELADALVADVRDEPGALPLLQTALLELWQHRDGRRLRADAYERLGGVHAAVARLAEHAYGQLGDDQRAIARTVLLRLATADATGGIERRRIPLAELELDRSEELGRVVALLVDHRLLSASEGSIELAHDALLREWPRLRGWIEHDRDALRLHRDLGSAAREWVALQRDGDALYRGARLAAAEEWAAEHDGACNDVERAFLHASVTRRGLERTQRRRRIRFALGGLSTAVVLVSVVAAIAVLQSREASRQRDIAASRGLAASSTTQLTIDPALGLALALRALDRRHTEPAANALRQATYESRALDVWPTHSGVARSLAVSRDGRVAATGGDDRVIAVRRLDSGRRLASIRGKGAVLGVAVSPDGRLVAGARDDGSVTISEVASRNTRRVLDLGSEQVAAYSSINFATTVTFSADGRQLAVGALDGAVRVIQVDSGETVRTLGAHADQVWEVRFDPSGTRLVSASRDATVRAWALRDGTSRALAHPGVLSASYSPDGRWIASAGEDGAVRVWAAAGDAAPRAIRAGEPLRTVRFSRDGRRLVVAANDGIVRVLDTRGGPALEALKGHHGVARGAEFVAGGAVVSTADDGELRRWDPRRAVNIHAASLNASFSLDGRRVLTGGAGGAVGVYDAATGARIAVAGRATAGAVARFSADAKRIVMGSLDGSVRIVNVESAKARVVVAPSANPAKAVTAVAFDPSASRVVSGGFAAVAVVQAVSGRGKPVVMEGHEGGLNDVRFSPDGRRVLTASHDGTARLWNASSGQLERTLKGHGEGVLSAAYDAGGRSIVTAGADGTVRVWHADGRGAVVILRGHEGAVNGAELSRDGTRVVSAGADGTVRVWDARGGDTLVVLYTHRGGALSASFSPDGASVVSSGTQDRIARVSACEVCGSLDATRRRARMRADRALNPIERTRFISG